MCQRFSLILAFVSLILVNGLVALGEPVTQPILTAWQEGNTSKAVNLFLDANWNAGDIFAPGMALGLTDSQFKALAGADLQLKNNELMAQLDLIKHLAAAVAEAGQEAASKSDAARARQCFTSLKQFGTSLDSPARMQLVRLVGQMSKKMAASGLAKLGS
jgi:hypothetical protein